MSPLRAMLEAYLRAHGFISHVAAGSGGELYWGHPELGYGRSFTAALSWQIGREDKAADPTIGYVGWDRDGIGVISPVHYSSAAPVRVSA